MYSRDLALLFISLALLIIGASTFITSFAFDYNLIKLVIYKSVPQALLLGIFGYSIGKILDNASIKK